MTDAVHESFNCSDVAQVNFGHHSLLFRPSVWTLQEDSPMFPPDLRYQPVLVRRAKFAKTNCEICQGCFVGEKCIQGCLQ